MSSSLYNLLKDNWPIEKVSELDENTIFVKGLKYMINIGPNRSAMKKCHLFIYRLMMNYPME